MSMQRARTVLVGLAAVIGGAVVLSSCVDLGCSCSDIPCQQRQWSHRDAAAVCPPDGGGGVDAGDGGPCEEGVAAPSSTGPQLAFIPTLAVDNEAITLRVGEVLTVTNVDTMAHTMTAGFPGAILPAESDGFDSGNVASGTQWAYRFCTARDVEWFCTTHPLQMNGYRLTVRE